MRGIRLINIFRPKRTVDFLRHTTDKNDLISIVITPFVVRWFFTAAATTAELGVIVHDQAKGSMEISRVGETFYLIIYFDKTIYDKTIF